MTLETNPFEQNQNGKPKKFEFHFEIIPQVILHPKQAFQWIVKQGRKRTWITPILLIVTFILLASLLSALIAKKEASATSAVTLSSMATPTPVASVRTSSSSSSTSRQSNNSSPIAGGGGAQGGQFMPSFGDGGPPPGVMGGFPGGAIGSIPGAASTTTSKAATTSTAVTTSPVLSMLASLSGFLIVWVLLGVLINLFSLALGGISSAVMALNLAAWASIPQAVRSLIQIVYFILGGKTIRKAGLSGLIPSSGNGSVFIQHLLSHIDLYFFWEVGLLAIGIGLWGGLSRKKSLAITLLSVGIILILQSLLGMGINMLSNINLSLGSVVPMR